MADLSKSVSSRQNEDGHGQREGHIWAQQGEQIIDQPHGVGHLIHRNQRHMHGDGHHGNDARIQESLQWRVYFFIAIFGGLRRGEVCALTWEDIDFSKHVIKINKAFANTKNGQILKAPKTDSAIRDLTLPDFCFDMLAELKKEQLQKVLLMGTAWNGHRNNEEDNYNQNYVFTQYDGQPVNLSTPSHKFKEIIDMYNSTCEKEKDKLPNIRLHDLRHTNATLLLSQNTDIETVSRRLGHSKTSVTLDIYGHALPENDEKASLALKKMFI